MLKKTVNKALSCTAIVAIVGFSAMAHDQAQVQKQATPVTPLGSAKLPHDAISVTNFQQTLRWYQDNPLLSLSENNNLSQILRLGFSLSWRLYFLTETKIYRQKVEIKAP